MTVRAIVLDLDGTLLDSQERASEADLDALRACAERGILLCVATARPPRLAPRHSEVGGDATFLRERGVYYNGAMALDAGTSHCAHTLMDGGLVAGVCDVAVGAGADVRVAIQCKEDYHSYHVPDGDEPPWSWGFGPDELRPFDDARTRPCSKIVVWHRTDDLTGLHADLSARFGDRANVYITDSRRWVQVVHRDARKETALLALLARHDIAPEEVVCFGDDEPDVGMLRTFGCGIAMANATAAAKAAADHVTLSNNESGIAHALDAHLGIM